MMMANGYRQVYALKGGWQAWQRAGYPVEAK
jgi:3-mercaptopyruvate sulfurtransferase SseA